VTTVDNVEYLRFSDVEIDPNGIERALPPVDLGLSATTVLENSAFGTVVGTVTVNPAIADALNVSLKNSSDGRFALEGNKIVLKSALDYETGRAYNITLAAVDEFGFETEKVITINVGDVNEQPTDVFLSGSSVREGAEAGTRTAYLSGLDPENAALTFGLVSNPGNAFKIVGDQLQVARPLNYDKVQAATVVVEAKDAGGATLQKAFRIDVIDVANPMPGTSGNDVLKGAMGTDIMRGGAGHDGLYGMGGNDRLYGGAGNDILKGGAGNDLLKGDAGSDKLFGGAGADRLFGGSGSDTFVFRSIAQSTADPAGRDTILDFSTRQKDKIDLKDIDANTLAAGNQAFKFIGQQDFHKKAGELRYEKAGGFTYVEGDVNGDGSADFAIALKGALNLSKAYFIL
jgi:Ca2+-binding RTX toxin-like protein